MTKQQNDLYLKINHMEHKARQSKSFSSLTNNNEYLSLKKEYAENKVEVDRQYKGYKFLTKIGDPVLYITLPFLLFLLPLIFGRWRTKPTGVVTGSLAGCGASLLVFFWLLIFPVKCVDLGCIVPVITVPIMTIIFGLIIAVATILVTKYYK